jgi:hypothetical protein
MADRRRDLHPRLQEPADPNAQKEALKFFKWAYENGDALAEASTMCRFPRAPRTMPSSRAGTTNIVPASQP